MDNYDLRMSDYRDWRESNSPKSSFKFSRRPRPPPPTSTSDTNERVPLGPISSKLSRRESKGGLRGIFIRAKTNPESNYTFSPVVEEPVQPTPLRGGSLQLPYESTKFSLEESPNNLDRRYDSAEIARRSTERFFTMSMRSKSTRKAKPMLKPPPKSSPKSASKPARRNSATWDPPPLFQAYPQAIKHAQLTASTLSADSILRISNHKTNGNLRDDITQAGLGVGEPKTAAAKKSERARSRHRRQISGSISKADWTQKIYVLVTSGYLLQYSGEGSFDRLPEKMMQLGKDSVAFASDVIPGKHWVLQISQSMDADGTPAPDARSLLSRLTFRGADYRRTATSLLLVLESAEELESWITTVRREIEALGGKKYTSETGKPKHDDKVMQLVAQPSHRCFIQRDPDKLSNPPTPRTLIFNPPWNRPSDQDHNLRDSMAETSSQSMVEPSMERLSIGTSLGSQDSQQLDSLRENSFRLSYMSSGQRTLVTSQGSSPSCSPTRETFGAPEESRQSEFIEEVRPRPNAIAINERRRSMQAMQNPTFDFHATPKQTRPRPHSTFATPGKPLPQPSQHPSPLTPNFSVPHAVGKRYSLAKSPSGAMPPVLIQAKKPSIQDTAMKGNRKSPPAPLKARPLSPVKDLPSPEQQPLVYTPSGTSFKLLPQSKPLLIEIPARSQSSSPLLTSPPFRSTRRASAISPKSPSTMPNEYQFPRRHSSMQALPNMDIDGPRFPSRTTSLRPTSPRIAPLPHLPYYTPQTTRIGHSLPSRHPPSPPRATPKPRRLTSMQLLTDSSYYLRPDTTPLAIKTSLPLNHDLSIHTSKSTSSSPTLHSDLLVRPLMTPPATSKRVSSSVQRLKAQNSSKALAVRRSMPLLVDGPPPAPPPNCALPPLPGIGAGIARQNLLNNVSTRNNVRV
jgi:hypothetical protein